MASLLYNERDRAEASMYGRKSIVQSFCMVATCMEKLEIDLLKSIMEALMAAETESKQS